MIVRDTMVVWLDSAVFAELRFFALEAKLIELLRISTGSQERHLLLINMNFDSSGLSLNVFNVNIQP